MLTKRQEKREVVEKVSLDRLVPADHLLRKIDVVEVTAGNIHDSVAFDSLYDQLCKQYPEHKIVVADSAYKTP